MSNVWKIIQDKMGNKKHLQKKHECLCLCPVEDINISDIFYKI